MLLDLKIKLALHKFLQTEDSKQSCVKMEAILLRLMVKCYTTLSSVCKNLCSASFIFKSKSIGTVELNA